MKGCILLIAMLLAGCSKGIGEDTGKEFPPGTLRLVAPANRITWVVPTTVDGTRCIVTVSNGSGGGHVACDFK